MTSELNASRAQQDVCAFTIERLTCRIAMQGFGPGCVSVLVATETAFGGEELLDGDQSAVFSPGIGRTKQLLRR